MAVPSLKLTSVSSGAMQRQLKPIRRWLPLIVLIVLLGASATPWLLGVSAGAAGLRALEAVSAGDESQRMRAINKLEQAYYRFPNEPLYARGLAQAYLGAGRAAEAVAVLEAVAARHPESLLVQHDLAWAYGAANRFTDAAVMWRRLGLTPERMAYLGDTHLALREYSEALVWYTRVHHSGLNTDADRAARMLFAAAGARQPLPAAALDVADAMVWPLDTATIIPGAQLRWLTSQRTAYAAPLSAFPTGDPNQGVLWWASPVGIIVHADHAGTYDLIIRARHRPADGQLRIWLAATPLATLALDEQWRDYPLSLTLYEGMNLIELQYVEDKGDLFIESLALELAPQTYP